MSVSTSSISNTGSSTRKRCTACDRRRALKFFRKYSGRSVDGRRPICVDCQREYEAGWREKNRSRLAQARAKRREKDKKYRAKYIEQNRAKYLYSRIKLRCEKRGVPFDLDKFDGELNERIEKGVCELTGLPLRLDHGTRAWNSPSLDRINPSDGYVYSNIRVVCFAVNAALGDWGEEVLKTIASAYLAQRS